MKFGEHIASLLYSDERLAEGRKWQAELREKYGTTRLEPRIKALQYAAACEDAVQQSLRSVIAEGRDDIARLCFARLADLQIEQGKFDLALESAYLSEDEAWIARAEQLVKALNIPDGEVCQCASQDLNTKISNTFVRTHHMVKGEWIAERVCNICGHVNITPEEK